MAQRLSYEMAVMLGAGYGYQKGQSMEESLRQLRAYFQLVRFDDATLVGLAQMVDPTYTFTPQDRAEREARRERSETARTNFYEFLHRKIEITSGIVIPRGLDMLLDFSGTEEAKQHNERVQKAFAIDSENKDHYINNDVEERTAIMKEFLDKMDSMDFSGVYNMSDEQLAREFPKMFALYSLCTEGGDGVLQMNWDPVKKPDSDHFRLDEAYTAKLTRYKEEFQGIISMLKIRYNHMLDPNYEVMHIERIVPPDSAHHPATVFFDTSTPLGQRLERDYPLAWYSNHIQNAENHRDLNWSDQVDHMARAKGLDPQNVDLLKLDGTKIQPAEMSCRSILRMQDRESGQSFLLQADGMNLVEVDPRKALDAAKLGGSDVIKALENADPWYIRVFTGSREFAAMKKLMIAVNEAVEKLERPISEKALEETMDMLQNLEDATAEYLGKKGMSNMNTKDSERLRVVSAHGVQLYAEKTAMLLDANRKADLEIQAKRATNNNEMEKNLNTEIDFGMARDITKNARTQEVQESKEAAAERGRKLFNYYMMRGDDDLSKLGRQIFAGLDRKTTDAEVKLPQDPVNMVARMVAYDLIKRERAINDSEGITEAGPVEKKFAEDPQKFVQELEKSPTLQGIVKGMNDADFRRFVDAAIGNKGTQLLTGKILEEQKAQLQAAGQQPKPEQVAQNQQVVQGQPQAPAAPEPPKGAVLGGMG